MKINTADTPYKLLTNWYLINKRSLPWRESATPYHIYISEIVFQQTRIEQGLNYYRSIIEKYPNFSSLAKAQEKDFLKVWQGLGYYSRAHNMLKTAQIVNQKYHGVLPSSYQELLSLPGIGPYTAAAIASIAFGLPCPVVDGNVKRVISRLHCLDTPIDKVGLTNDIENRLQKRIIHFNPSDFNQALMELGALICTPSNPNCMNCPLNQTCCAFRKNVVNQFPVKALKKAKATVFLHYYIIHYEKSKDSLYMVKRDNEKIWKGLYEFPCVQTNDSEASVNLNPVLFPEAFPFSKARLVFKTSHILTHRLIEASFYEVSFHKSVPKQWHKTMLAAAGLMPVHRIIQHYLSFKNKTV